MVFSGLGGLLGELLHLVGHHGLSGLSRARRFDSRIQRQQIGLLRDRGDHLDHLPDFGAGTSQFVHDLIGALRHFYRAGGHLCEFLRVLRDFTNTRAHFFRARRHRLQVFVHLLGRGRHYIGLR